MPIDRRITNGLAWAGALIVVAIPVADFATSQFAPNSTAQVAVVDPVVTPEPEADKAEATLPTPVSQRPAPVAVAEIQAAPKPVAQPEPRPAPVAKPDPVTTASAGNKPSAGVVDDFLNTGRPLPSYITGTGSSAPAQAATVQPAATPKPVAPAPATVTPAPATPAAAVPEQVAAEPNRVAGYPTPVAQRPAALPQVQVGPQPPLSIGNEAPLITAEDLEDWESGPLSEFLARRQAGGDTPPPDYDADGFFLDQGPNSVRRFPNAYDEFFYPFE